MFGLLDYLKLGAGLLAGVALFSVYDGMIDDPLVRREARAGYVSQAEKTALEAQLAKERRLTLAVAQSLEEYRKRLSAAQRAEQDTSDRHEAEIADYEAQLKAAGKRRSLDRGDIDFLMRP